MLPPVGLHVEIPFCDPATALFSKIADRFEATSIFQRGIVDPDKPLLASQNVFPPVSDGNQRT